jgi:hypothetical protein
MAFRTCYELHCTSCCARSGTFHSTTSIFCFKAATPPALDPLSFPKRLPLVLFCATRLRPPAPKATAAAAPTVRREKRRARARAAIAPAQSMNSSMSPNLAPPFFLTVSAPSLLYSLLDVFLLCSSTPQDQAYQIFLPSTRKTRN